MRLWLCSKTLKRPFTPPLQIPNLILSPVADPRPTSAFISCGFWRSSLQSIFSPLPHPSIMAADREVHFAWEPIGWTSLEIRCTVFALLPVLHFKVLSLLTSSCSRPLAGTASAFLTLLPRDSVHPCGSPNFPPPRDPLSIPSLDRPNSPPPPRDPFSVPPLNRPNFPPARDPLSIPPLDRLNSPSF